MSKQTDNVRVRFAPSPTGKLHLGSVRTMLFQVLFARHYKGTFILRIEDTDQERLVEGAVEQLLESLQWLGITPDEGPRLDESGTVVEEGDFGPYVQSNRREIYQKYALELLDKGLAYYCFATKEELDSMRQEQIAKHQPPRYDGRFREYDPKEAAKRVGAGETHVIRFKMPESGQMVGNDIVHGEIEFDYAQFDDHIIIKSDGLPTYHFAAVLDDHLMKITHVFRGEEWISSWPRHVATYEAFNWDPPQFAHMPNILGKDKRKLSKRHGAKSLLEYRDEGYLPEAVINSLVFLGWNPKTTQELFSWDELVSVFDAKGINKANPVFDPEKMEHTNGIYIRALTVEGLVERAIPWLEKADLKTDDPAFVTRAISSIQDRAHTLSEIPNLVSFYWKMPKLDLSLLPFKEQTKDDCARLLDWAVAGLESIKEDDWTIDIIERELRTRIELADVKPGEMLWPIRAALTGEKYSPGAFEVAYVLGKLETIKRLTAAKKALEG